MGRVALVVREPHHRVLLGIVLVDVARLRVQGARRLAADDVEDLVEVERRRHGARGVDERRELPVAGGDRARVAGVAQRERGEVGHLADEELVGFAEPARRVLLGELEHAQHFVVRHDRRPDGGQLAPIGHRLGAGRRRHVLIFGVGDEYRASRDHLGEVGDRGEIVQATDPGAVALGQVVRPDRLGAERAAFGEVLVDAALRAVDRLGDLLRQRLERLGEELRVLSTLVDERVGVLVVVVRCHRLLAGPPHHVRPLTPAEPQGTIVYVSTAPSAPSWRRRARRR